MIRYLLFARILGIVVLSFTASFLVLKGFLFIPALFGFCILALSVFLYKDQQKTVKRMEYLIESIHYGDLSLFYPSDSMTEDEKAWKLYGVDCIIRWSLRRKPRHGRNLSGY